MKTITQSGNKENIKQLNEELENYFANTIIPQLFVDAGMVLRKFTPPAMKQFSLKDSDVGRPIEEVQEHFRYPTFLENIREVMTTGEILEKEVQTTDKRWFQMNILPYVVRESRKTNGVIITFVDITARLNALKELEKLNADHNTLMFALSHDIRQPLSTMILVTDELANAYEHDDEKQFTEWVATLKRASATMKELVNDFTEHIRIREEKPMKDERLNIGNIFDDVILALREEIYSNKVNISTRFDVGEITFPRKSLRSIVYNLMSNAIKYRRPSEPLRIDISTEKRDDQVLLRIKDNGIGIAPEQQFSIFEKYMRLDHGIEGTGMGLYIVSRMLEQRGDRIEVKSTPGKGSTFEVYIKH